MVSLLVDNSYSCAFGQQITASPCDVFSLRGSPTRQVRITKIGYSFLSGNPLYLSPLLILRSTLDAGGAPYSVVAVPHTTDSVAATAVAQVFTTAPVAGTAYGAIRYDYAPVDGSQKGSGLIVHTFSKPIILANPTDSLCLFLQGPSGATFAVYGWVEWTEYGP